MGEGRGDLARAFQVPSIPLCAHRTCLTSQRSACSCSFLPSCSSQGPGRGTVW